MQSMMKWCMLAAALGALAQAAVIVVPDAASGEEREAGAELARIWTRGNGAKLITRAESEADAKDEKGPWFFIGETNLGRREAALPAELDRDGFRARVLRGNRVVLRGANGAGDFFAVTWFAQQQMGVRWYEPGDLGEKIPQLDRWQPPVLDRVVAPAFMSRSFYALGEGGELWAQRNGLHDRLPHSHAMSRLFAPSLFDEHPEWFPLREGKRYRPASVDDSNWQPSFMLPAVAAHAAGQANSFFAANPTAEGFSISLNDSLRFDQSREAQAARGTVGWFRGKPNYSDEVFTFANRVADLVAARYPQKLVSAYAYGWSEQTPSFPLRPNVVPWLTAERAQGFDPTFAQQDRELIARWCKSGARIVGLYDYLYGTPYLVPRVTTRLTASSIVDAYGAGVRAYFAETNADWALDGPKLWLAAQLLWDPKQNVDALLNDYYAGYWQEAAEPMRAFFERCEKAWMEQPRPGFWLKYYYDEAQVSAYPPALRRELRALLDQARAKAQSAAVKARVEKTSGAFEVVERFGAFNEARAQLDAVVVRGTASESETFPQVQAYVAAKAAFAESCRRAVEEKRLKPTKEIEIYWRNDPSALVAEWLLQSGGAPMRTQLAALADQPGGAGLRALLTADERRFVPVLSFDSTWRKLSISERWDDLTTTWQSGSWRGTGDPGENRRIKTGGDNEDPVLVFRGCRNDAISQWTLGVRPSWIYRTSVEISGHVSAANQVYLVLAWLDQAGRYVGEATSSRVPAGDHSGPMRLVVFGQAPIDAAYVGVGVYVKAQGVDDVANVGPISLQMAPPRAASQ